MDDLILHHFDISPYAEKIRVVFGMKGLSWRSVQIPVVMPKPDLVTLTGGYRKTPVLQIGAHVYCDTGCIVREIDRRYPSPSLFPTGDVGTGLALGTWGAAWFKAGAGAALGGNADVMPADILEDRRDLFEFLDFGRLQSELAHFKGQIRAHAALVDSQLADGRSYLTGAGPAWVDVHAYFNLWLARHNLADADRVLGGLRRLAAWEGRIAGFGHGRRSEMTASDALDVARDSEAVQQPRVDADDPLGLTVGARVKVVADDYGRDPVEGDLLVLDPQEIALRRTHPRLGTVVVHFPRLGYRVEAA